jgi:hypothetical protein
MGALVDRSGRVYGRLTVVMRLANNGTHSVWLCRCECGTSVHVHGDNLQNGHTQSCGCWQRRRAGDANRTHGFASGHIAVEWNAWSRAKGRCFNQSNPAFDRYGGRGITMCDAWRDDFAQFMRDMGPRPSADHSLDRINNNGDYAPGNCRWATRAEQSRNKRNNIKTRDGEVLADAARAVGLRPGTALARVKRGYSIEAALNPSHYKPGFPAGRKRRKK